LNTRSFFSDFMEAEFVSADIPALLSRLGENGVTLLSVQLLDPLTVHVRFPRNAYRKIRGLAEKRGVSMRIVGKKGLFWQIKGVLNRPVLMSGILLLLFLTLWLPTRVLFVQVEGNRSISPARILDTAELCGIRFGASRREVRSEKMKNSLLQALPELEWAGINTSGCTAVISVQERGVSEKKNVSGGVSALVAVRDGIVESCTATAGTPLCKTGEAVKAGQILVSGYTDCGISIRAQRASGEVFAKTVRNITAVTPSFYRQKGAVQESWKKISLLLGKKRINFSKDSGIYGTTCDKMYTEYYLTLPGGFRLPIGIAVERWTVYEETAATGDGSEFQNTAENGAKSYLLDQMISGRILDCAVTVQQEDHRILLMGSYLCSEMIARERSEEILENYGKDN